MKALKLQSVCDYHVFHFVNWLSEIKELLNHILTFWIPLYTTMP